MIYYANQLTGFYMRATLALNGLITTSKHLMKELKILKNFEVTVLSVFNV